MRSRHVPRLVALAGALLLTAPAVNAESEPIYLGDERISVERAAELSCHDLERGVVRCFFKGEAAQADIKRVLSDPALVRASVLLTGYVIVYQDASYGGAYRTLSIDYNDLGSIGWNDRISSFKSFGATGEFYEHAPPGGLTFFFGTSSMISYVGNTYNDKFSSFDID